MKIKYLYITIIILLAVLITLVVLNINKKEENNLSTIRVSEVTHSVFYTPFYVAIENGYFEEFGIDIELMLVSGSDNVGASVLSNDTNVGLAGPESAVYVYTGGEKDYLQVFAGLTKRDGQFIISRSDKEFKWDDLIGKSILIGRSTGMPGLSFFKALENQGINKEDVLINSSVEFAEISGAFIGGEADYVNLFEPVATKIEQNKQGYVATSVGLYSNEFPYTAFYARKSYIENNKNLLTNFTKALAKGITYTLNNPASSTAKIIHNQFSDTSQKDLEIMIDRYLQADVWLNNPYIQEDFYNELINLLKENNLLDKSAEYNKLVYNLYE